MHFQVTQAVAEPGPTVRTHLLRQGVSVSVRLVATPRSLTMYARPQRAYARADQLRRGSDGLSTTLSRASGEFCQSGKALRSVRRSWPMALENFSLRALHEHFGLVVREGSTFPSSSRMEAPPDLGSLTKLF